MKILDIFFLEHHVTCGQVCWKQTTIFFHFSGYFCYFGWTHQSGWGSLDPSPSTLPNHPGGGGWPDPPLPFLTIPGGWDSGKRCHRNTPCRVNSARGCVRVGVRGFEGQGNLTNVGRPPKKFDLNGAWHTCFDRWFSCEGGRYTQCVLTSNKAESVQSGGKTGHEEIMFRELYYFVGVLIESQSHHHTGPDDGRIIGGAGSWKKELRKQHPWMSSFGGHDGRRGITNYVCGSTKILVIGVNNNWEDIVGFL